MIWGVLGFDLGDFGHDWVAGGLSASVIFVAESVLSGVEMSGTNRQTPSKPQISVGGGNNKVY